MIYHDEIDMWAREEADYNWPKIDGAPELEDYLPAVPTPRMGHWESYESGDGPAAYTSLDLAKAVQFSLRGKEIATQKAVVADVFDELDYRARDVKSKRAALAMADDSRISAHIGGYTVTGESQPIITLRLYELAASKITSRADYRADDGRRMAGPYYVPVVAVRGLSILAK